MSGRVLVIVPAHDEAESLPATLRTLLEVHPREDVLVVDDGSADGTREAARAMGIRVARHAFNLGVGGALQTGFRVAVAEGYEVGVQFDADGQHAAADLGAVVAPVLAGTCDVSIGSRFVRPSGYHAALTRRMGMMLFSAVVRMAIGRRVTDTTSGYRAYARRVMEVCQHDLPHDFPDAPLLIALARRGFSLHEVPVQMRDRTAGHSFYTFGKSLYYPYKNLLASLMAWFQRTM
jgi:glycosyltransferase involved in cell wall biosynthesis